MKHILLLLTGGTIGSVAVSGVINTDSETNLQLLHGFRERYPTPDSISFTCVKALDILSENLHPNHWRQIITVIEAEDLNRFDGIILTHGTDTLAFSSSLLGLYFHNLPIPMVIVSSDLPLLDPNANGFMNFLCAVDFIRKKASKGVFVVYKNRNQPTQIHLATRLSSCLQLSNNFISVQSAALMHYENGDFTQITDLPSVDPTNYDLKAYFSKRILLIRPYPGLDYSRIDIQSYDVILHDLYHSGTACVSVENSLDYSLLEFVRICRQQLKPIYLAPALKSINSYASTIELESSGAHFIWNTSLETAYAKLLLAYASFSDASDIANFLQSNIAHELLAS
jgi:L-asparaginase/Glu-tRNA(Gln) amidotransferase subunit D